MSLALRSAVWDPAPHLSREFSKRLVDSDVIEDRRGVVFPSGGQRVVRLDERFAFGRAHVHAAARRRCRVFPFFRESTFADAIVMPATHAAVQTNRPTGTPKPLAEEIVFIGDSDEALSALDDDVRGEKWTLQLRERRKTNGNATESNAVDDSRRAVVESGNERRRRVLSGPTIDRHRTKTIATVIQCADQRRLRIVFERFHQSYKGVGREDDIVIDHREHIELLAERLLEDQLALRGNEISGDDVAIELRTRRGKLELRETFEERGCHRTGRGKAE